MNEYYLQYNLDETDIPTKIANIGVDQKKIKWCFNKLINNRINQLLKSFFYTLNLKCITSPSLTI